MSTLVRIVDATPLEGLRVRLRLTNGKVVVVDLHGSLPLPAFAEVVADPARFRQVTVERGTLCWPGGLDLDPDVLILGGGGL